MDLFDYFNNLYSIELKALRGANDSSVFQLMELITKRGLKVDINLDDTFQSFQSIQKLEPFLQSIGTIKLGLPENFSDDDWIQLSQSPLREKVIALSSNDVRAIESNPSLLLNFPHLTELRLIDSVGDQPTNFEFLRQNLPQGLRKLSLGFDEPDTRGKVDLSLLQNLENLTELSIECDNESNYQDLEKIKDLKNLRVLELHLPVKSLLPLMQLENLEVLELPYLPVAFEQSQENFYINAINSGAIDLDKFDQLLSQPEYTPQKGYFYEKMNENPDSNAVRKRFIEEQILKRHNPNLKIVHRNIWGEYGS